MEAPAPAGGVEGAAAGVEGDEDAAEAGVPVFPMMTFLNCGLVASVAFS